jgi:hypothetical protein
MASEKVLAYLINHVALPPQLPSGSDSSNEAARTALRSALCAAARVFRTEIGEKDYATWSSIIRMLDSYKNLHTSDAYDERTLRAALADLTSARSTVTLYLEAQNAALIITESQDLDEYHIEAFEASPKAEDVLASSRLIIDYPGGASAVQAVIFENPGFQQELCRFLAKASREVIKDFAASSFKAASQAYENRDTTHPGLIGECLLPLLEASGRLIAPPTTRKHVRDEVLWTDGNAIPWRRSPEWLVLRVALQRSLCLHLGGAVGLIHYKFFIAFFLQQLCRGAIESYAEPDRLSHLGTKLARKLTKLELEKAKAPVSLRATFDDLFDIFRRRCEVTLDDVKSQLQEVWARIQKSSRKIIPTLPTRASDEDLSLSLLHSSSYLHKVMQGPTSSVPTAIPLL